MDLKIPRRISFSPERRRANVNLSPKWAGPYLNGCPEVEFTFSAAWVDLYKSTQAAMSRSGASLSQQVRFFALMGHYVNEFAGDGLEMWFLESIRKTLALCWNTLSCIFKPAEAEILYAAIEKVELTPHNTVKLAQLLDLKDDALKEKTRCLTEPYSFMLAYLYLRARRMNIHPRLMLEPEDWLDVDTGAEDDGQE